LGKGILSLHAILPEKGDLEVNGKSIMGLLLLGAAEGTTLVLRATGEDGPVALQALVDLVEAKFGERE